jgi:hypothetical protein
VGGCGRERGREGARGRGRERETEGEKETHIRKQWAAVGRSGRTASNRVRDEAQSGGDKDPFVARVPIVTARGGVAGTADLGVGHDVVTVVVVGAVGVGDLATIDGVTVTAVTGHFTTIAWVVGRSAVLVGVGGCISGGWFVAGDSSRLGGRRDGRLDRSGTFCAV